MVAGDRDESQPCILRGMPPRARLVKHPGFGFSCGVCRRPFERSQDGLKHTANCRGPAPRRGEITGEHRADAQHGGGDQEAASTNEPHGKLANSPPSSTIFLALVDFVGTGRPVSLSAGCCQMRRNCAVQVRGNIYSYT